MVERWAGRHFEMAYVVVGRSTGLHFGKAYEEYRSAGRPFFIAYTVVERSALFDCIYCDREVDRSALWEENITENECRAQVVVVGRSADRGFRKAYMADRSALCDCIYYDREVGRSALGNGI